ncbi:MAG: type II secretion system protein GspC [Methylococcaceae bacterium]|nr:type II secretion system protein GspC [Methylococcaceae bacterium]
MIVYLIWQLSLLTWLLVPVDHVIAANFSFNDNVAQRHKQPSFNVSEIIALNFFGAASSPTSIKQFNKQQISAPETSLQLKLRGLRKGQGAIPSSAIIENGRKIQDIYYLGETVPGNSKATIHEIYSQRLILKRGGKYETLTLFEVLQKKNNEKTPALASMPVEIIKAKRAAVIDKTRNKALTEKLTMIVDKFDTNPLSLSDMMVIKSVESDNTFQGYAIAPGKERVLFAHLGFKKGDVITAINDVKLDNPGKIMSLMSILSSAQELEVKIMRGNQPLIYRYKVR